ncbi:MAG: GAF domain-containing protein [Nitrospirae bacterium]|nr:GAF domain-containing protein [Nitrospirota bacterium]
MKAATPDPSGKRTKARQLAEAHLLLTCRDVSAMSSLDTQHLVQELQVHQVELEMQNEELRWTQVQLEASRDLYDGAPTGYLTMDSTGKILEANLPACTLLGGTRTQVLGRLVSRFVAEKDRATLRRHIVTLSNVGIRHTCEVELRPQGDMPVWAQFESVAMQGEAGSLVQLRTTVLDVTLRKQAEAVLLTHTKHYAAVATLGLSALLNQDMNLVLQEATRLVAVALGADFSKVLELLPGGQVFLLRAGTGWPDGLVGHAQVRAGLDSQAGYTLTAPEPVVVQDLNLETRFSGPPLLREQGISSGMSVAMYVNGRPWGVLAAHTRESRLFSQNEVNFLQAVANMLGARLERQIAEQALAQSERLLQEALDERERMAMNLHDGAIQSLFALGLTLREGMELIGESADAARTQIAAGLASLNGVIRELRESIRGGTL